ncbi:MAG: hypothetical protein R2769_05535 [Saprospiraceae bacterium]
MDWDFMLSMQNVLLIRNPEEIIYSYSKVIENPTMEDVGIEMQYELYNFLLTNGKEPRIIDTNDVLKNPSKILKLLCTQLGIPFFGILLTWEKGPRKKKMAFGQNIGTKMCTTQLVSFLTLPRNPPQ